MSRLLPALFDTRLGHWRAGAALLAALALLAGCGTPSEPQNMAIDGGEQLQLRAWVPVALRNQVSLGRVEGGAETSRYWGSKISDESLRVALDASLRGSGMANSLPEGGRYELQAKLMQLQQPLVALDVKVALYMEYKLVERASGKLVYQRQMRLAQTTPLSAAILDQSERTRLSNEAALRQSISQLLRELVELRPVPAAQ